jgi:hypothetical protein
MELEALIKLGKLSLSGQALDGFFSIESLPETGAVDREHIALEDGNETHSASLGDVENPSGTRAEPTTTFSESQAIDDDCLVNLEQVEERFKANTANRFKANSGTQLTYLQHWRRFVAWVKLEEYTPKQLMAHDRDGPMWQTVGGKLLLRFMREGLPEIKKPGSRMVVLASLKTTWETGLGIPWPLNTKRDFGRTLKGTNARTTPKDEEVLPFFKAMESENDAYLKSLMAVQLSCGLRSANHLARLTWRAVQFEDGKPIAIVANGAAFNFKTDAWLIAYLPTHASEALAAWKAESKDSRDDTPIWPQRPCNGPVKDYSKPHNCGTLDNLFLRWKQRHRIDSSLTLMHFRHWVKRKAEQAGLDPSTADYLQQHQPKTNGGLSYGKVRDAETVIDEQRSKWPDGPLGFAFGPKVKVLDEDAPYLRLVADFKAGKLSEMELAIEAGKVKATSKAKSGILEP